MKKYLKVLVAILPPLTAVAVQLIAATVLEMAYSIGIGLKAGTGQAAGALGLTVEITYLISALAVMSSGIVFLFWYRHETFGEIRGKLAYLVHIKNICKFACLALGCQLFVSGLLSILTEYFPKAFDNYGNTINSILSGNPIVVVIVTIIIAPITEELIFRGVTLHMANRNIPFLGANVLQAMLFGMYHGNLVQGIYAAGLGFILGLIYEKYRTIYAPILLHMMVNASAFFLMLLPEAKHNYLILLIIGFVLVIVSLNVNKAKKNQ
jgi:uncharacterized protein